MKLRTENIKKSYKGRKVVKGVSIEVNRGEIVGLLGPNGAGKTTSFYMIVGLVSPNEGRVYLDDKDITTSAMYKRAQMGIGYLPQEVSVFRKLSVEDNIMTILELVEKDKAKREEKLERLINEFGLNHVRKNLGQSLSGGEKRRTEIARALATNPKFILLDEPFAGVDPIAVEDIQTIVAQLKERNIGVLITDHNVQETLSITDRTYLLFEGAILKEGTAEELAADEQVRKVYLGENFELRKKEYGTDKKEEKSNKSSKDIQLEKDVEYIDSIILSVKRTFEDINGKSGMGSSGAAYITELEIQIKEFREYFLIHDMTKNSARLFDKIKFGPVSEYKLALALAGSYAIFFVVPVFGWAFLFILRRQVKRCSNRVQELLEVLLKYRDIMNNPAMEEMYDKV